MLPWPVRIAIQNKAHVLIAPNDTVTLSTIIDSDYLHYTQKLDVVRTAKVPHTMIEIGNRHEAAEGKTNRSGRMFATRTMNLLLRLCS